jgi:hypothetical protein
LYIKTALFPAIPLLLGCSILGRVRRMGLAIGLQVTGVFRQPVLEPIVILLEVFRVLPAPVDQILDFQCPLAVWSPTTLLAILHPGIGDKEIITKSASLFSHLAPPE